MANFDATMDTSSIEAFARGFVKKYGAEVVDVLDTSGNIMVTKLKESTQTVLEKGDHTGSLRRSWKKGAVYFPASDQASIDVTSGLPYAMIHDHGGVIRPVKAKALAIPNRDNKWFFKGMNKDLPSPSELRRTNPAWAKQLWFDKMTLKDVKGQVAYFLKRSVRMPARWYIREAVKDASAEIHDAFSLMIKDALEEGQTE